MKKSVGASLKQAVRWLIRLNIPFLELLLRGLNRLQCQIFYQVPETALERLARAQAPFFAMLAAPFRWGMAS